MDQQEQLYYFKLPNTTNQTDSRETEIVSLIDSSGSMNEVWPHLANNYNQALQNYQHHTITFSDQANYIDQQALSRSIGQHGGGSTEIEKGVIKLIEVLSSINKPFITVLFISDGRDNRESTLLKRLSQIQRKPSAEQIINFICVGIGRGFPTFISMELRKMFHNGDDCVPPLYLIETDLANQLDLKQLKKLEFLNDQFRDQFQQLQTVFNTRSKLKTSPCLQFPWDQQQQEEHWGGSWVVSSQQQINVNDQVIDASQLTIENVREIGQYWLQNLHVKALNVSIIEQAKIAYKQFYTLVQQTQQEVKIQKKMTFAQRIHEKNNNSQPYQLQEFLKEMKNLSESNYLKSLSEAEAAKRIAIGTQVGKYHNKAVQIRGITVDDYIKDRDEFIKVLKNTQLSPSDSERSMISLENQKEIFTQPDFIEGLLACPNQFELVTTLPVIGYGVQIRRFDGSMINPWIIEVKSMARFHKYVDSLAIYGAKDNTLIVQTGNGDKEEINCVLPLYTKDNADIGVLLQQKLFHLLMTFNVMQNADTCFDTAYSALLSNCFLYLILESQSQWRDELIKLIKQTFDITYRNKYKFYTEELMKNPKLAVVTEHPNIKTKCEDPCKPLLILETIKNDLTKEQIKSILDPIIIEAIARGADQQFSQYFQIQPKEFDPTPIFDQLTQDIIKNAPENLVAAFYRKQELLDYLDEKILALNKIQFDFQIELNIDKIKSQQRKYCYNNLQIIYKYFLGEEFSNELYIQALNHGQINNSYERSQAQIETDLEKIKLIVKQRLGQELKNSNKIKEQCLAILYPKLQQQFKITHKIAHIFPSIQGVQNIEQYKVTDSNLVSNACLCEQCPHYLKVMPTFNEHMKIDYETPGFHKTIKQNLNKSPEEIFELIAKGACLTKVDKMPIIDVQTMNEEREELIKEIEQVKVEYISALKIQQDK